MRFDPRMVHRVVPGAYVLLGTLALCVNVWGEDTAKPKDVTTPKLVQIETKDKEGADFAMKATETERGDKTSTIKVIRKKRLGSVGSSMFVMQAFYEIAKARKSEYFVNLKEWNDKDGDRIYIGGFTNKKDADIKQEFGDQFEYNNESGQKRKLLSVSQFAPLFERMPSTAPSVDSKKVQPEEGHAR